MTPQPLYDAPDTAQFADYRMPPDYRTLGLDTLRELAHEDPDAWYELVERQEVSHG